MVFLLEHLEFQEAVGDPDARWEPFQVGMISRNNPLSISRKSRQVGWSWTAAAKATARAILYPKSLHLFVSINQEEAAEKVRYANAIREALDLSVRPKLIKDNIFGVELQNGSRLLSLPCRAPRGKPRASVYLDEFAHYPNDKLIYQGALPVISKGGIIEIGSSPFGAGGRFWEIYSQSIQPYPGFIRRTVEWWKTFALCKDLYNAFFLAPGMPTEERVYKFGTERLITIFENMLLDDFQQEYECQWLDASVTFIDWDLIKRNQILDQAGKLWHRTVNGIDEAFAAIDELYVEIAKARVEQTLTGGTDIGRTHDKTEIILNGESTTGSRPYRLGITLDRVEFDDQQAVLNKVMEILPVRRMLIDKTGLGMQLAENSARNFPDRAVGVWFDSAIKELMSIELKRQMQNGSVPLPLDRNLGYQIHSIRRQPTEGKNLAYNTTEKREHHADRYWALALSIYAPKYQFMQTTEGENFLNEWRG